jgi:hypothetical protein
MATEVEEKQVIINTGGNRGGGPVVLVLGIAAALGIGYIGNKWYQDNKAAQEAKKQNNASQNAGDINYQMASNFATLFNVYTWLNADEIKQYQQYLSQVTNPSKMREYYNIITRTRNFDSDVSKYVPAKNQDNAQKNAKANADALSTYRIDSAGKTVSNVMNGEQVLPKNTVFKIYNDQSADSMKKALPLQIGNNTSFGQWQGGTKSYYVGEGIEFTAIWYVDRLTGAVVTSDPFGIFVKHTQEKVFFRVWGIDDKQWYWVDAFEFKRKDARLNGLGKILLIS